MNLVGPLLVLGYFSTQYASASKQYGESFKVKQTLPKGPNGEVLLTRGGAARYRQPPQGTAVFKPIEHRDWARIPQKAEVYRQQAYNRQSEAKANVVSALYDLDPVKIARNLPRGTHFLDWPGSARFPSFYPDRYATSHSTFRNPETKALFDEGRAKHTRADLRVGGY